MSRAKVFVFKGVPSRFHHGALGVARTLGRLGVPVAANDELDRTAASRSRYRSDSLVWRPWPTTSSDIVERLVAWGQAQDEPALLMPVDDAATMVVEEHAADLAHCFRFARQPEGLVRNLSSKWTMAELALEHGIATARVAKVGDVADLDDLLADFGLPVVIKRIEGWTAGSRSVPSVSVARSREQAREIVSQQPENFMLQEYIPGSSDTSWMFNGYFDGDSRCLFGATGYKIRQYPLSGGFTTLGQLTVHDEIQTEIVRFLGEVGYRGIVDLGLRFDARDGSYKLLDVNPRVGSTFRLFVDSAGDDVVRVCLRRPRRRQLGDQDGAGRRPPLERRAARLPRRSRARSSQEASRLPARAEHDHGERARVVGDRRSQAVHVRAAGGNADDGPRRADEPADAHVTDAPGEDPVRAHFRRDAEYWRSIYEDDGDRAGAVYHERLERVLTGVDALGLTPPVRVIDVGAGAGLASVALAERGYDVLAVDSTRRMLELTEARAAAAGLIVRVAEADASSLPIDDASVDLVVAVGLIPWLVDTRPVLDEFRRVLRPPGGLVITADNRWRLTELADPSLSPLFDPCAPLGRATAQAPPRLVRSALRAAPPFARRVGAASDRSGLRRPRVIHRRLRPGVDHAPAATGRSRGCARATGITARGGAGAPLNRSARRRGRDSRRAVEALRHVKHRTRRSAAPRRQPPPLRRRASARRALSRRPPPRAPRPRR